MTDFNCSDFGTNTHAAPQCDLGQQANKAADLHGYGSFGDKPQFAKFFTQGFIHASRNELPRSGEGYSQRAQAAYREGFEAAQ